MKSLANRHNIFKVFPLLAFFICFFLGSCSENSSISSFDAGPKNLKDSPSSRSATNLIDNSSLQRGCIAANAWVEEHADNLPTSFAAISKYPVQYRKAIFRKLTPKQKANVWSDRLRKVPGNILLTKKQHALLGKIIKNLSPAVFDKNADRDFISDKTLKSVFGETKAGNIFASLRPVQEMRESQLRSILYGMNRVVSSYEVGILQTCSCSQSSDYCGLDHECTTNPSNRCSTSDGCGTFWLYDCDGVCIGWPAVPERS